jgi:hypothetical protein
LNVSSLKRSSLGERPALKSLFAARFSYYVIAREFDEAYTREEIDAKIARGIESLDRGEGVDGDEVLDGLEAEIKLGLSARTTK